MASTFAIWFRRSRITLNEKHFRVIFNNIDNSILSEKNHKTWLKQLENTELCELLDVEPKAQCKVCLSYWDIGIVYCTCGHFLQDDTTEKKKYIKSVLDLFSIPNFLHQERSTTRSPIREERRGSRISHMRISSRKKCSTILEHSRPVHSWCTIHHARIGSHWRSDSRSGQIGERGPRTPRYWRRTESIP